MEVIGHQAVAVQAKGVAALRLPQGVEKGLVVGGRGEHGGPIVAAVDGMVEQAVSDGSGPAWHGPRLRAARMTGKRKMN